MSINYPQCTLRSARSIITKNIEELRHLTTGDNPAAWVMAAAYASEIATACRVTERELADYAKLTPGQAALRAVASQGMDDIPTETPEEREAFDAMDAESIDISRPDPFFNPMSHFEDALAKVRPAS